MDRSRYRRSVAAALALLAIVSACADGEGTPAANDPVVDPSTEAGSSPGHDGDRDDPGGEDPDGDASPTGELDLVPGADVTVDGVVVANSMDPCLLPDQEEDCVMDLGGILTVDADGHEVSVHYGGGEWPPCDNPSAISQGESARVGMRVTVYAEVTDDDHFSGADLDTCGSDEYSIDTSAS